MAGDRRAEATILAAMAIADAMLGEIDVARARYERVRAVHADLGRSLLSASTSIEASRIEILAGDIEAAEALLRADDAALADLGEHYLRSTIAGLLANSLEILGRTDEAEAYVTLTLRLADDDDVNSQVLARTVRAKLDARLGLADAAIAAATDALELADTTADIDFQGDVHSDFGSSCSASAGWPKRGSSSSSRSGVTNGRATSLPSRPRSDRSRTSTDRPWRVTPRSDPCRSRRSGS